MSPGERMIFASKVEKKTPSGYENGARDQLFLARPQAAYSLFWHRFIPGVCAAVSKCLFSTERISACYPKCQCVLTIAAGGGFRWRSKWPAGHSGDHSSAGCLLPETVDSVNHESTVSHRGGWWDSEKEVQRCWTITWGLTLWGGGKQEAGGWVISREKCERCVLSGVGVECCNYVLCWVHDYEVDVHVCVCVHVSHSFLFKKSIISNNFTVNSTLWFWFATLLTFKTGC